MEHKLPGISPRKLLHSKASESRSMDRIPTKGDLQEGREVYCIVEGKARLYKNINGIIWYWESGIQVDFNDVVTGGDSHDHSGGDGAQISHTGLADLNTTNYTHLTAANATDLTDGGATTLHTHATLGYAVNVAAATFDPVDSTTYYFGVLPFLVPHTTAAYKRLYIPKTGTIKAACITWASDSSGTDETISMYIRLNNTTDISIADVGSATTLKQFNNYTLNQAVTAGDYIEIKIVCPAWATNPSAVTLGGIIYIE